MINNTVSAVDYFYWSECGRPIAFVGKVKYSDETKTSISIQCYGIPWFGKRISLVSVSIFNRSQFLGMTYVGYWWYRGIWWFIWGCRYIIWEQIMYSLYSIRERFLLLSSYHLAVMIARSWWGSWNTCIKDVENFLATGLAFFLLLHSSMITCDLITRAWQKCGSHYICE